MYPVLIKLTLNLMVNPEIMIFSITMDKGLSNNTIRDTCLLFTITLFMLKNYEKKKENMSIQASIIFLSRENHAEQVDNIIMIMIIFS